jgi:hypothetical protein
VDFIEIRTIVKCILRQLALDQIVAQVNGLDARAPTKLAPNDVLDIAADPVVAQVQLLKFGRRFFERGELVPINKENAQVRQGEQRIWQIINLDVDWVVAIVQRPQTHFSFSSPHC